MINTRKSKDKEGVNQDSNKKIPKTHVDLMKQHEKLNFKNKFNEASRNSIDKHIKRISEVRKIVKYTKPKQPSEEKILSPKPTSTSKPSFDIKANSVKKAKLTMTDHRKNNSSLGGSLSNVMKTY
jgi:hypothetical protein